MPGKREDCAHEGDQYPACVCFRNYRDVSGTTTTASALAALVTVTAIIVCVTLGKGERRDQDGSCD
jgi:hypothetical protein